MRKTKNRLSYFDNLKNVWPVLKLHLSEQFSQLSEEDLQYKDGQEELLLNRLQEKLSQTREETERMLQDIYLNAPKSGSKQPAGCGDSDKNLKKTTS